MENSIKALEARGFVRVPKKRALANYEKKIFISSMILFGLRRGLNPSIIDSNKEKTIYISKGYDFSKEDKLKLILDEFPPLDPDNFEVIQVDVV